jgi:hypothetical protein
MMIRALLAAGALAMFAAAPALAQQAAQAAEAPAPAAPKFSTKNTIGELLDNAEAKAAFAKVFPDVVARPQIESARRIVFADIASRFSEYFPVEKVKELDTELAKIR